jgi:hypothetical protein
MATGRNLGIATAQNKGGVGLPLQIHDTSVAFVSCHLPSDSKGKSKLSRRNRSAHRILRDMNLAQEDVGFDVQFQHDHLFFLGDLNYRMDKRTLGGVVVTGGSVQTDGTATSLVGVTIASKIEKKALGNDPLYIQRRYNMLRHPSDPLYPSIKELIEINCARQQSQAAWSAVLRADELCSIIADGDAFHNFTEQMPCFAPSYKRKVGLGSLLLVLFPSHSCFSLFIFLFLILLPSVPLVQPSSCFSICFSPVFSLPLFYLLSSFTSHFNLEIPKRFRSGCAEIAQRFHSDRCGINSQALR